MIRQAISCDVCGADMQQTTHWFIARRQGEELRIAPWNPRIRSRAAVQHLCGQTCLHKLLDEFLARDLATRASSSQPETDLPASKSAAISTDASLTARIAHPAPRPITPIAEPYLAQSYIDEHESSARLIPSASVSSVLAPLPPATIHARTNPVEAWKREQTRLQSEAQSRSARRRSIA